MSHLSKVQVAIRDIDVLGEALRALGLRCVGEVAENYEFADTFNQCDVIAVNAVNRVMAFNQPFDKTLAVIRQFGEVRGMAKGQGK